MIVDQINWSVDKFLLGIYVGTTAVAVYSIGAQFNTYFITISSAMSGVFTPRINTMVATEVSEKEISSLFLKVGRVQFLVLGLILTGFAVIGREFIMIWAGENYEMSYYIALLLMVPVTVQLIQTMGVDLTRARNIHRFRSIVFFGIAVGNLLLSIPLCQLYQGVGSALGTAIAIIVGSLIVMNIYYQKKMRLDIPGFWMGILKLVPSMLLPLVLGFIVKYFIHINGILMLLVFGTVFILTYSASVWFIGMNTFEKDLIGQPVKNATKWFLRKLKISHT